MSPVLKAKPTNAELRILRVLWKLGPCTVAQVKEELQEGASTGYTTVLKLLQLMHEKGIVEREESFRPHVYRARFAESDTQKQLLQDLIGKAFGGSAGRLVLQALSTEEISREDLAEIRKMINQARAANRK